MSATPARAQFCGHGRRGRADQDPAVYRVRVGELVRTRLADIDPGACWGKILPRPSARDGAPAWHGDRGGSLRRAAALEVVERHGEGDTHGIDISRTDRDPALKLPGGAAGPGGGDVLGRHIPSGDVARADRCESELDEVRIRR